MGTEKFKVLEEAIEHEWEDASTICLKDNRKLSLIKRC